MLGQIDSGDIMALQWPMYLYFAFNWSDISRLCMDGYDRIFDGIYILWCQ